MVLCCCFALLPMINEEFLYMVSFRYFFKWFFLFFFLFRGLCLWDFVMLGRVRQFEWWVLKLSFYLFLVCMVVVWYVS